QHGDDGPVRVRRGPDVRSGGLEEADRHPRLLGAPDVGNHDAVGAHVEHFGDVRPGRLLPGRLYRGDPHEQRRPAPGAAALQPGHHRAHRLGIVPTFQVQEEVVEQLVAGEPLGSLGRVERRQPVAGLVRRSRLTLARDEDPERRLLALPEGDDGLAARARGHSRLLRSPGVLARAAARRGQHQQGQRDTAPAPHQSALPAAAFPTAMASGSVTMMKRKPCSIRMPTSSTPAMMPQATSNSLHARSTVWIAPSTACMSPSYARRRSPGPGMTTPAPGALTMSRARAIPSWSSISRTFRTSPSGFVGQRRSPTVLVASATSATDSTCGYTSALEPASSPCRMWSTAASRSSRIGGILRAIGGAPPAAASSIAAM